MDTAAVTAGGYVLTRRVSRDDRFMASDLLPAAFPSFSPCPAPQAFEYWWDDESASAATDFGVDPGRVGEVARWYRSEFGVRLGAPTIAFFVEAVREFAAQFVADTSGLVLLGSGLAPAHRDRLLAERAAPEELGEYGVYEMLQRRRPLATGERVLGFEPLSYQHGLEHSWVCNGLEREAADQLGIRPDAETGLLSTETDAAAVIAMIEQGELGAEPGLWLPWLVVEYPM
jgi:hypothetical protein